LLEIARHVFIAHKEETNKQNLSVGMEVGRPKAIFELFIKIFIKIFVKIIIQ
jgi:hypothetical protein